MKKEEEEKKRLEAEALRRDEERRVEKERREAERKAREEAETERKEAEAERKEAERKAKEEEAAQKEEEEQERRKQEAKEMLELYRTQQRHVDFDDDDDDLPEEKPTIPPPPPPKPTVTPSSPKVTVPRSGISAMLAESYAPIQGGRVNESGQKEGEIAKSTYFEYPQYEDYRRMDQNRIEEKQEDSDSELPVSTELQCRLLLMILMSR